MERRAFPRRRVLSSNPSCLSLSPFPPSSNYARNKAGRFLGILAIRVSKRLFQLRLFNRHTDTQENKRDQPCHTDKPVSRKQAISYKRQHTERIHGMSQYPIIIQLGKNSHCSPGPVSLGAMTSPVITINCPKCGASVKDAPSRFEELEPVINL